MPVIHVNLVRGRPQEMKDRLAEELTQAVVRTTNAPIDTVRVVIHEVEPEDWFVGGVSKRRTAAKS